MTSRENFKAFFKGGTNEWTPTNRDVKRFMPDLIADNVARGLVSQQRPYPRDRFGGKDLLGTAWFYEAAAQGSITRSPLLEDFNVWESVLTFPELSSLDWETCARENAEYLSTDKMLSSSIFSGFFERMIALAGFENAAMALVDEDQLDAVRAMFDRLADFYIAYATYMNKSFGVEFFDLHDDWGSQRSPFFSNEVHNGLILPYVKKVADGIHKIGCFLEMHSCGKIEALIPGLISAGVDTWRGQNINDKSALVDRFGDTFKFGVDLRRESPCDSGQAVKDAEDFSSRFYGKNIWFTIGRGYSPAQAEAMFAIISQKIRISA